MTTPRDSLARTIAAAVDADTLRKSPPHALDYRVADAVIAEGWTKPRAATSADRTALAAMIDPHAHDAASWTLGTEANRLRRVANALKRADRIMETWELKK